MSNAAQPSSFNLPSPDTEDLTAWREYRDEWDHYIGEWGAQHVGDDSTAVSESMAPGWDRFRQSWRNLWELTGKTWRFEPEISRHSREHLRDLLNVEANVAECRYPFSKQVLTRAELEYLLDPQDDALTAETGSQDTAITLDLRGADLRHADLHFLKMDHLVAGLSMEEWQQATHEQREAACIHLEGAVLRGVQMEGAILRGAHLDGADLFRANLRNAELQAAHLKRVDLRSSILQDCDLRGAQLESALLNSSFLSRADLHRAKLSGADLSRAHASDARFSRAVMIGVIAKGVSLEHADLRSAQLRDSNFQAASLEGANFSHSTLDESDLRRIEGFKTSFFGASLRDVDLSGSRIERADFTRAVLSDSDLRGASMDGAKLESAELVRCHLRGVRLREAVLQGACLDDANLSETRLDATNMTGTRLRRTNFSDAVLDRAQCPGAQFTQSIMLRASLKSANLNEANLKGANLTKADLTAAAVGRAVLDGFTRLREVQLNGAYLADVDWGDANLAVVHWNELESLGEEDASTATNIRGSTKDPESADIQMLESAVRAYRQLATALQERGIDEPAYRFAYRAHCLQRRLYWRRGQRGLYLISWLLNQLAGYGYAWWRTAVLYAATVAGFTLIYFSQSSKLEFSALSPTTGKPTAVRGWGALWGAFILSVTSFHGRGFFPGTLPPNNVAAVAAALEAVVGFVLEVSFIATFTRRFFGR